MKNGNSRPDSPGYWVGVSAVLLALAALLVVVGLAVKSTKQSVLAEPFVDGGIVVGGLGVLALGWSFRRYFASGRLETGPEPSPLEKWLQGQIDAAATLARDRHVQEDKWYFDQMRKWEFALINEMALAEDPIAPGLVEGYRLNPLTGLTDGVPPPHGTKERDDYYRRRLDWLERKLRELRTGKVEPEPEVSDDHRKELQSIAEGIERYIHLGREVSYHPPGQNGSLPVYRSFRAHFPALARMLDEWDELVPALEAARKALWEWVEAEAKAGSIVYYGPVPYLVQDALEHNRVFDWKHHDGWLWVGGSAIFEVEAAEDAEALQKPLDDLLVDAAVSEEGGTVLKVLLRVEDAQRQILGKLEDLQAMHVIRGRCELCGS